MIPEREAIFRIALILETLKDCQDIMTWNATDW